MKTSTQLMLAGLGLGVGAFVIYKGAGKAVEAAQAVGNAVNPLNHDNVFAGAVNKVGGAITGDSSWSLGAWLYDVTHPEESAPAARPAPTAAQALYMRLPSAAPFELGYDALSLDTSGASFKDRVQPYDINPFRPLLW